MPRTPTGRCCATLLLPLILVGCAARSSEDPLAVAAAASLAPVLEPVGDRFTAETGVEVLFSYGATASLAQQIRNGGPFDIFLAADALHVDELIREGLLEPESRTVFAHGRLMLALATGQTLALASLEDLLDPAVRHIAMANPTFAPYGAAARQALERAGLWERLAPKVIYGESVRQAGQMVASGNATVGLLAASTTISFGLEAVELPAGLYDPIQHVAGIRHGSARHDQARALLAYLTTAEGTAILDQFGLDAAPP